MINIIISLNALSSRKYYASNLQMKKIEAMKLDDLSIMKKLVIRTIDT